jgi:hypothetical protein
MVEQVSSGQLDLQLQGIRSRRAQMHVPNLWIVYVSDSLLESATMSFATS